MPQTRSAALLLWGVKGSVARLRHGACSGAYRPVSALSALPIIGLRASSVADVNKVGSDLITTRRVIFVPNVDIKDELKRTSINITCYDRNGEVVKRVT